MSRARAPEPAKASPAGAVARAGRLVAALLPEVGGLEFFFRPSSRVTH